MWFTVRTLKKSIRYAWKGVRYVFQHEQNFRIQVFFALVVIVSMGIVGVTPWEAVALIFVIVAVLVLEILNTVVERFIDLLKPRMHHQSKNVKDLMAAAVLLTSFGALLVGAIIFYPYIFQ